VVLIGWSGAPDGKSFAIALPHERGFVGSPLGMTELIFSLSVAVLFYIYIGYSLFASLVARLRPRSVQTGPIEPTVTVLIAAHNEEANIQATVQNKLEQNYSVHRLDVIVVSDDSIDATDDRVRALAARYPGRVRAFRQSPRAGKTAALNLAMKHARSEIVVFSDANSLYHPDTIRNLVRNFADPSVGYVSGRMIYADPDGTVVGDGCTAFMRYENRLRVTETLIGSVIGVDGGVDAVRRDLYRPMRPDQLPDFVLPLRVVEQGYRVVYEPDAVVKEDSLRVPADEYRMRVRVCLRALWALRDMAHLFNPFRYGLFAWQLVSHKLLRYGAAVPLTVALISNLALWDLSLLYKASLTGQLACYLLAGAGYLRRKAAQSKLTALPYYFLLVNIASAHAFMRFVRGEKQVLWHPRKGA
jgi:cellulose synthase/poly-beta-1,6-N-acetylglucosamine synthase-like glycosyltransferase